MKAEDGAGKKNKKAFFLNAEESTNGDLQGVLSANGRGDGREPLDEKNKT